METSKLKCDSCKRLIKNVENHKCEQCLQCGRYFVNMKKHKCLYRKCQGCQENVKITTIHNCGMNYRCQKCAFTTKVRKEMQEHRKNGHLFTCTQCSFQSKIQRDLKQHYYTRHKLKSNGYLCPNCSLIFEGKKEYEDHLYSHIKSEMSIQQSAFKKSCVSYGTKFDPYKYTSIEDLFADMSPQIISILSTAAPIHKSYKASITIFALLDQYDPVTNTISARNEFIYHSKTCNLSVMTTSADYNECIMNIEEEAIKKFDGHCNLEGSGWVFQYVSGMFVELAACQSLTGGCSEHQKISSNNIWDTPSEDGECFYVAVSKHFNKNKEPKEVIEYARHHYKECRSRLDMNVNEIERFEKKYDLAINVILYENGELYGIRSTKKNNSNSINILMVPVTTQSHVIKYHYMYIVNLHKLVNEFRYALGKYNNHDQANHVYVCTNCMNYFSRQEYLKNHIKLCLTKEVQTVVMPEPKSYYKFSKFEATQRVPIIGAFDFEAMMKPGKGSTNQSINTSTHKIISYSFVLVTDNNEIIFKRSEQSENNCLQLFLQCLVDAQSIISSIMKRTVPMELEEDDLVKFNSTSLCYICGKTISSSEIKVRDHCHFTGKFIGATHQYCNLQRRKKYKIPIYAHNFSGYDSHFLVQAISQSEEYLPNLSAMAYNSQKFRSISLGCFRFLDSMHFISDSLENIINDLHKSEIIHFLYWKKVDYTKMKIRKNYYYEKVYFHMNY